MRRGHWKGAILALALAGTLAACGSSSSSSSKPANQSEPSSGSSVKPAAGGPGAGRPPVVIGDKNFTEEYILGSLYQQALAAKGYHVTLKGNIGSSEITWKALTSGQIQMYPEYTGTLLTVIAGDNTPPTSPEETFTRAQSYVHKHGFTLLPQTPFFDADTLATSAAFATKHHLAAIGDLKPLGSSFKLGGPPENRTRYFGLVGLQKVYGLNPSFVPLAIGLTYKALDTGQVDVATAFTTDPQLASGKYRVLTDTKHLFGFQNVAPVVSNSLLKAEGPEFASTINKVSSLLTIPAVVKMNAAVALDQQAPDKVAHAFLAANGLA